MKNAPNRQYNAFFLKSIHFGHSNVFEVFLNNQSIDRLKELLFAKDQDQMGWVLKNILNSGHTDVLETLLRTITRRFSSSDQKRFYSNIVKPQLASLLSKGNTKMFVMLLEKGKDLLGTALLEPTRTENMLAIAMERGDAEAVTAILSYASSFSGARLHEMLLKTPNEEGDPPLLAAFKKGHVNAVNAFYARLPQEYNGDFLYDKHIFRHLIVLGANNLVECLFDAAVKKSGTTGVRRLLFPKAEHPPLDRIVYRGDQRMLTQVFQIIKDRCPHLLCTVFSCPKKGPFDVLFVETQQPEHQQMMLNMMSDTLIDSLSRGTVKFPNGKNLKDVFEMAIDKKRVDVLTALFEAIERSEEKDRLLKAMLSDDARGKNELLCVAARNNNAEAVQVVLDRMKASNLTVNVVPLRPEEIVNIMVCLVQTGDIDRIKKLFKEIGLQASYRLFFRDEEGEEDESRLVRKVIEKGRCEFAQVILDQIYIRGFLNSFLEKHTALAAKLLFVFLEKSDITNAQWLLDQAKKSGHLKKMLLPTYRDEPSLLSKTARFGSKDSVSLLLEYVSTFGFQDQMNILLADSSENTGDSFLQCVVSHQEFDEVGEVLHELFSNLEKQSKGASEVRQLLSVGLSSEHSGGKSLLRMAAERGDARWVDFLIQKAGEVDYIRKHMVHQDKSLLAEQLLNISPFLDSYNEEVKHQLLDALSTCIRNRLIHSHDYKDISVRRLVQDNVVQYMNDQLKAQREKIRESGGRHTTESMHLVEMSHSSSLLSKFIDAPSGWSIRQTSARRSMDHAICDHKKECALLLSSSQRRGRPPESGESDTEAPH